MASMHNMVMTGTTEDGKKVIGIVVSQKPDQLAANCTITLLLDDKTKVSVPWLSTEVAPAKEWKAFIDRNRRYLDEQRMDYSTEPLP